MALDYSFLKPAFLTFLETKLASFANIQEHQAVWAKQMVIDPVLGKTPMKSLLAELSLTGEAFAERFLNPWKDLTPFQLKEILSYFNHVHRFRFGQELVLKPVFELNALHWTTIHIQKLNLNGLVLFTQSPEQIETSRETVETDCLTHLYQAEPYCMPYLQCYWCGRLDTDPRGKAFGYRGLSICHLPDCKTHSVNLPDHEDTCCYRQWNRVKDALKQTLKNQGNNSEKVTETFLAFCEARFQQNLRMTTPPRPEKEKPSQWKHPWTDLENKQKWKRY